jgi:hypothetical protein
MNIKEHIEDTLKPLKIPVCFQGYYGTATTYITYFCYNEQGEAWAENKEKATGLYIQVDRWSKMDFPEIDEQIKSLMESVDFTRTTAQDLYEQDTKTFHKAMRFCYIKKQ